jgi:glutathione S-transferase
MAEIPTRSPAARSLRGLHLYHAGKSCCSARVRLVLEEKGLEWTSHHVDIYARRNVTPEYFAINPKGLVPTLIHDGGAIVESNDIMLYLEDRFPEPPFSPSSPQDTRRMEDWMQRCGDLHLPAVKTYAYARLHAANVVKTPEEVALYRKLQKDPELLAFHARHDEPGSSFSEEDLARAARLLNDTLAELERSIAQDGWIAGGTYTLADMSWAPAIVTIQSAGFPLGGFGVLMDWFARVTARPAWQIAVAAWRLDGVETPPAGSLGRAA